MGFDSGKLKLRSLSIKKNVKAERKISLNM